MSMKLSIALDEKEQFEIYQRFLNQTTVFIKFENLLKSIQIEEGKVTLGIPIEVLDRLTKAWEKDRHKFETELVDFVTEIETAMEELKVGDWYDEDEEN